MWISPASWCASEACTEPPLNSSITSRRATPFPQQPLQECRYLVKDFGTSQSPKSTRQRDSLYCPDR
ncbi:MAG: hypothetical protein AB2807_06765, partial [Candidatus Sedimenticola endophacoides]